MRLSAVCWISSMTSPSRKRPSVVSRKLWRISGPAGSILRMKSGRSSVWRNDLHGHIHRPGPVGSPETPG